MFVSAVDVIHWLMFAFAGTDVVSLYHMSWLNPLNLVPLRLLCRFFGVSDAFWDEIVVPLYASSFLTTNLDWIPSVILPIVDDIISVAKPPALES